MSPPYRLSPPTVLAADRRPGDRSCPELAKVTHCHNCPVFATAGRRFLDAPRPPGYLDEWTARLAAPDNGAAGERVQRARLPARR